LGEDFTPQRINFKKLGNLCGLGVVSPGSVLRSFNCSDLYAKLVEILGDAKYLILEAECSRNVGKGVSVLRDGPGYIMSILAGHCLSEVCHCSSGPAALSS